jgi:D-glycero-D-manno-heptose 1,7-bisphosphate phosphatase
MTNSILKPVSPSFAAVFLDRDGVINQTLFKNGKHLAPDTIETFLFFPGVKEAILALKAAGYLVIVVTNQPDVARGWQKKEVVDAMNEKVRRELAVDDLKVCFHTDEHQCECRKPKPGMITEAAKDWGIDLSSSYMIGDRDSDLEAGKAAGCVSYLVGDGGFASLALATAHILGQGAGDELTREFGQGPIGKKGD